MEIQKKLAQGWDVIDSRKEMGDRAKYMNASEALGCIREQWYTRNVPGYTRKRNGYATRGSMMETAIVEALGLANVPLAWAGDDQERLVDDTTRIAATPDGALLWGGEAGNEGMELKTIDPRTNVKKLPRRRHVTQLQISMELMRREHGVEFAQGRLIYVDASDWDKVHECEVPRNDDILEQLEERAHKLLRAKSDKSLPREGQEAGGAECRTCDFKEQCGVRQEMAAGKGRSNRGSNLDATAKTFISNKEKIDAINEEQSKLKEEIKTELEKRKIKHTTVGDIDIRLEAVSGRKSLDKKAVQAAGINLADYETMGASSERLLVQQT